MLQQNTLQNEKDLQLKKFINTFSMPTQEHHTPIQQLQKEVNILTTKITQQQIVAQESKVQLQQLLEKIQQPNSNYNEIKTQIDEQFAKYNTSLLNQYQALVDATKTSQKAELVQITKEIKQQFIEEVLAVKTEKDLLIKKHLDDYKLADETIKTRVDSLKTVAEDLTLKINELKSLNTYINKEIIDFGKITMNLYNIEDQVGKIIQTSNKQSALLAGIEHMDDDSWWNSGDAENWVATYINRLQLHHETSQEIKEQLSTIVDDVKMLLNEGIQNIKQSVEINMQSHSLQDQDQQYKHVDIANLLEKKIEDFSKSYSQQTQKIHDLIQVQVDNQQSLKAVAQFIKDALTQELDADDDIEQLDRVIGIRKMLDEALKKSTDTIKTYTDNLVQIYQQVLNGSQGAITTFENEQSKYIQQNTINQTKIDQVVQKLEEDQSQYQAIKQEYISFADQFKQKTHELQEQRQQDAIQHSKLVSDMQFENDKTHDMIYGNEKNNVIGLFQIVNQANQLLEQAQQKIDGQIAENLAQKRQVRNLVQSMLKLNEQYTLLMDQTSTDIITKMGKKLANELEKQLNDKIDAILSDRKRDLKRLSSVTKPMVNNFIKEEDVEDEVVDISEQTGRGRSYNKTQDEIPLRSYSPALDYFRSKLDSKILLSTTINRFRIDIYCYIDVDSFLQEQSQRIQTVIEVNLDQTNFPYRFRQYVTTPVLGMALNHKNDNMLYVLVAILPKALFFLETIGICDTTFSPQMQAILLGSNTNVQLFVGQLNSTNGKNTARFVQTEDLSSSFGRPLNEGGLCICATDIQYLEAIVKRNKQPFYKEAFNIYVAVNHVRCINMQETLEYISQKDISKQGNEANGKNQDNNI